MKKILIILTVTLFISMTAKGQNLFFFGERSYPCSDTFTLQSNSGSNNLNILFAKDGTKALLVVSIKPMSEVLFTGNLIIYLDDGTVITCIDNGKNDYVDKIASAVYYLTNEQLSKLKGSNINTIRYELKGGYRGYPSEEGSFSASNKVSSTKTTKGNSTKIDFPALITEFYVDFDSTFDYSGETTTDQGIRSSDKGISYDLQGRGFQSLPAPKYDYKGEGRVVVEVSVDRNGRVTAAVSGIRGSTTLDEYLLRVAREAALQARFEPKPDAPLIQKGTITYNFILR